MDDLISREKAIEAVKDALNPNIVSFVKAKMALEALPSAQPETHDKRTETHACDCISRQAAIDALDKRFDSIPMEQTTEILQLRKDLRKLPSAQSEIIRCKDCKWFGRIGCAISIVDDSDKPTENDFCSFAERRTDEM